MKLKNKIVEKKDQYRSRLEFHTRDPSHEIGITTLKILTKPNSKKIKYWMLKFKKKFKKKLLKE